MKDLRNNSLNYCSKYNINEDNCKIRFFGCGEYGELSGRPHIHLILFMDFPLVDLELEYVKNGFPYYQSKFITDIWAKGRTQVCNFSFDTANYTARYIMKKQKGEGAEMYERLHIEPEFVLMSRKPGIGYNYYNDNKDSIYKYDKMIIPSEEPFKIKPSRYFDKLFDIDDHERFESIKFSRENKAKSINYVSNLVESAILDAHEKIKVQRLKI